MDRFCITHGDTTLKTEVSDPKNCMAKWDRIQNLIWAYPWDPEGPGKLYEL